MSPGRHAASTDPPSAPGPMVPVVRPRRGRQRWLLGVVVAFVLMLLVRGLLVQAFYIPSGSMQPTLEPADRLVVNKVGVASTMQRGDLVVFDGTNAFGSIGAFGDHIRQADTGETSTVGKALREIASILSFRANESDYVKRVVGLPGDHVVCCDAGGRLSVNGVAVNESYLFPGDSPSEVTFDVLVPAERIWVMGDHRSDSSDSRDHLGEPGGGMVRMDDVIGRVAMVYWPLSRAGVLTAPDSLANIPAGTTGERRK